MWTQEPIGHAVCVLFSVVQTIGHSSLWDMLCVCCSLLFKLLAIGAYWTCCVCVVLCCSNYWTQEPMGHAVCVLFSVVQTIGHSSLWDMLCVCCSLLFKLLAIGAYWTCCVCVVLCCSNYWTQEPIGHAVCVLFSVVQTIGHSSLWDMLCVCCSLLFKLLDTGAYWTCCVCVFCCDLHNRIHRNVNIFGQFSFS